MRKQIKLAALAAAAGMAAVSAQAQYNGDLLVGFSDGTHNDFVYDLGSASSLTPGETWNLNSFLGAFTLSSVQWGVIGDNTSTHTVWSTTDGSVAPRDVSGHTDLIQNIEDPTESIYGNLAGTGAGDHNNSIDNTANNSWNQETVSPGNSPTAYANTYGNPNVTGETSDYFYTLVGYNTDPQLTGNFSLDGSGTLTFNPVPEPSTMGLLTGAGLLMFALRNKFRRI